jgi:3-oxoacyl-[acyl-carrier-protein] synthase II
MERRRVVVTGMGAVTPLGLNLKDTWQGILSCKSGADYITLFDASSFPVKIASEVKEFNFDPSEYPETGLEHIGTYSSYPATDLEHAGRNTKMAVKAAKEAFEDSGLAPRNVVPERFGIYLGSGEGQMDFYNFVDLLIHAFGDAKIDEDIFLRLGKDLLHPLKELEQEPFMTSQHLAHIFNAYGPNFSCLTACAAGSHAIGEATELIREGKADLMLSGGCHSMIHPFGVIGFILLSALSTRNDEPRRASRPFDLKRNGFVLGEGAGILILEELGHARNRHARIYGEILGYGASSDAYRITDVHPEGRGAIQCMQAALNDAKLNPEDIDYINAHGTSTQINDRVETLAIRNVFKECACRVPISSTKSMTGHLIAAAGAVELEFCLMALNNGIIPPTINYENPDPDCDLDYVPNSPREKELNFCLSNSFGFGGQNASLIVGR